MEYRPRISVGTDNGDMEVVLDGVEDIFPRVLPLSQTLHTVKLSNCLLRAIPDEFSTLLNLVQIYLDHNKIKTLPLNFHHLTKVKILHLHYNRISTAPLPMDSLVELDMFSNRLPCFPAIGLTTPLFDMAQNYMLDTDHDHVMSEKAQALRDKYGYVDRCDGSKPNAPTRLRLLYDEFKESDTEDEDESLEEPAQDNVVPIVYNHLITNGYGHSDTDSISSSDEDSLEYENAIAFNDSPEEIAEPEEDEVSFEVQAYLIEIRNVDVDNIEHAENAEYVVHAYMQNGVNDDDGDENDDEDEANEAGGNNEVGMNNEVGVNNEVVMNHEAGGNNEAEGNDEAAVNNEDGEFEDNGNEVYGLGVYGRGPRITPGRRVEYVDVYAERPPPYNDEE